MLRGAISIIDNYEHIDNNLYIMKFDSGCSGCFAGLACGTRVEIINLLKEKERMSVLEIAKAFEVAQPTISHHLKYLKKAGILKSKKEGRKVFYFIDPKCKDGCDLF